jgi:hypothetical protein
MTEPIERPAERNEPDEQEQAVDDVAEADHRLERFTDDADRAGRDAQVATLGERRPSP